MRKESQALDLTAWYIQSHSKQSLERCVLLIYLYRSLPSDSGDLRPDILAICDLLLGELDRRHIGDWFMETICVLYIQFYARLKLREVDH